MIYFSSKPIFIGLLFVFQIKEDISMTVSREPVMISRLEKRLVWHYHKVANVAFFFFVCDVPTKH